MRIVWIILGWFLLLLAPTMAGTQDSFAQGEKLFAAGNYPAAVKSLQCAFQVQPDNLMVNYYLGRAAFETEDYEAAIVAFERILMQVPQSGEIKLQLARAHSRLGSQKIAWIYFENLQIPDIPSSVRRQAQQYVESKGLAGQDKLLESLLVAAVNHEQKVRPFAEMAKNIAAASMVSSKAITKSKSEKDAVGFVAVVRGKVKATHAQHGARVLKVKSEIFQDDTIVTAKGEGVQIAFKDNTVVRLGANSTMVIDTYLWDADKNAGEMKTIVKEGIFSVMGGLITKGSPDKFSLETPAATIGVRGSMFSGSYVDGQFNVVFVGGTGIYVAQGGGTTDITQSGYGLDGVYGGAFSAPAEISSEELKNYLEGLPQSTTQPVQEGEKFNSPHKRAFACFDNANMVFVDDPTTCEAVCNICHKGDNAATSDTTVSYTLIYTLTFDEAVPDLTVADLTITGGEIVAGSLTKIDEKTWTFAVKATESTADLIVAVNNGKRVTITRRGGTLKIVEGQTQNPELLWTDMVYPGLYPLGGVPSGIDQPPVDQAGSGQAGSSQAGSGQAGSGQAGSGQAGSGQLPTVQEMSSSNSYEQNWAALPSHHKVCRDCHPDQSIDAHNHPIFINMALDFGDGMVEEMGLILCTSCHDPHSNQSALLRLENSESKLCQYCHGK